MRRLFAFPLLAFCVASVYAADPLPEDSPKAAKTRMLLKQKVTLKFKDTSFGEVVSDIKDQVKGLALQPDTKAGVNLNKQITYSCKDKPLEDVFDELFGRFGWGYYVKSQKNSAYDGLVYIRPGKERGWEGKEGRQDKKDK